MRVYRVVYNPSYRKETYTKDIHLPETPLIDSIVSMSFPEFGGKNRVCYTVSSVKYTEDENLIYILVK